MAMQELLVFRFVECSWSRYLINYVVNCTVTMVTAVDRLVAPEEVKIEELRKEHAAAIHELYPANDMESVEVFERLIKALPAFGVFSSDELAAWMVQSYYGAMFRYHL